MKEAKFQIGDRVQETGGGTGEVLESLFSTRGNEWFYEVKLDETGDVCTYKEDILELAPVKDYGVEVKIDIAENVVIVTMYESVGGVQKPVCKGHGHLIHEGEQGIAQAVSYAAKRMFESLDTQHKNRIYFKNGGSKNG